MNSVLRRLVLVLAAPALLLAGCGEPAGPTAPRAADLAALSRSAGAPDLERLAKYRTKPVITIAWAKKWIGPEGGRLEFLGFAVDVPAGAVGRSTLFSIRLPVDPHGSERVMAEFGPHGSTFAVPVSIELPYAGTTMEGQDATVLWWNSAEARWEDMRGTRTADQRRLTALTDHFSTYGTGSRGGTILMSGE